MLHNFLMHGWNAITKRPAQLESRDLALKVFESSTTLYRSVAAGQTDTVVGSPGAAGEMLGTVLCVVSTSATSQVQIRDGAGGPNITILPNNAPVGTHAIRVGINAVTTTNGGWRISTGAGVSALVSYSAP